MHLAVDRHADRSRSVAGPSGCGCRARRCRRRRRGTSGRPRPCAGSTASCRTVARPRGPPHALAGGDSRHSRQTMSEPLGHNGGMLLADLVAASGRRRPPPARARPRPPPSPPRCARPGPRRSTTATSYLVRRAAPAPHRARLAQPGRRCRPPAEPARLTVARGARRASRRSPACPAPGRRPRARQLVGSLFGARHRRRAGLPARRWSPASCGRARSTR